MANARHGLTPSCIASARAELEFILLRLTDPIKRALYTPLKLDQSSGRNGQ
jgi:hypothetical protein